MPQEVAELLSQSPPPPEPRWEPDNDIFYEIEIIRQNSGGYSGKLSNESRVFIPHKVTGHVDHPPGSKIAVRIRHAGPDDMYMYYALEIWKEETPESAPNGSATLADIFIKENL